MAIKKISITPRQRRHARVRAKMVGTTERPRLVVFRSNRHFEAQIIDDSRHMTLAGANDREVTEQILKTVEINDYAGKSRRSWALGKLLAEKVADKHIKMVVFDRGGYRYHGRVKAFADGARQAGLVF